MWKYGFLFLICTLSFANVSDFEKLSNQDLENLHQKALLRIEAIDAFRAAQSGVSPEPDINKKKMYLQQFERASTDWVSTVHFDSQQDTTCNRYVRNVKALIRETNKDYHFYEKVSPESELGLILRTRIEALQLLLKGELNLADENSEAGKTPVTNEGRQCVSLNRNQWLTLNFIVENHLDSLNKAWWGERGLRKALPVSAALMKDIIHKGDFHYQWAVPEFLLRTIAPVVAIEFITGGIIPGFKAASTFTRNLLRWLTAAGSAAFGAYKGYEFGSINFQPAPYIGDSWNQLQFSAEKLISLDLRNPQIYYSMASEIENATLQYNEGLIQILRPQMIIAHDRFGSLDAARSLAERKLWEIETVMKQRKTTSSLVIN